MNNDTIKPQMFMLLTSTLCLLQRVTFKLIPIPHVTPSSSPAMNIPAAIPPTRLLTGSEGDKIKECLPIGRERYKFDNP